MTKARILFHIDMNCYFVSCELANNQELMTKPVAVAPAGHNRKSIILTANYEARKYGVHSAMRVSDALELCKDLILLDSHMELYAEYSRKFFDYFLTVTPLVEPASIDEAYLDVTDVCEPNKIVDLAHNIQNYLWKELKLPCSIGIAPNRFLAKMGSDMKKPMGITIVRKREIKETLWSLPVEKMIGVGKKTLINLKFLGIKTIGDLARYTDFQILSDLIGASNAKSLKDKANGEDDNQVDVNRFTDFSSMSNSQTFDTDLYDQNIILTNLKILVNTVANRLERHEYKAQTFTIQIRYNTFRTINRSKTIDLPTSDNYQIFEIIKELFEDYYEDAFPVRLLGVAASKFTDAKEETKQMSIFDDLSKEEKDHAINKLLNNINVSFGSGSITKGFISTKSDENLHKDKYNKEYLNDLQKIRR